MSPDVDWLDLKYRIRTVPDGVFRVWAFERAGLCLKHKLGDVNVWETS